MSSDFISRKLEGSSQCSLQLGETAESLFYNKPSSGQQRRLLPHQKRKHLTPSGSAQQLSAPSPQSYYTGLTPKINDPCLDGEPLYSRSIDRSDLGFTPLPADISPCTADDTVYSDLTSHPLPHPRPGKKLSSMSSPLSYSLDSAYHLPSVHHSKQPHPYPQRIPQASTKALVSPPYRGDSRLPPGVTHIPTSRSLASLPDKLIHSSRSRINPPLPEKVSQDSGHSTIPRSRTVSPGDFSLESSDALPKSGSGLIRRTGYSPLHIQTSLESGHDSPTPSVCTSCKRELGSPGLYLLGSPDSTSQASNISGMETSV